MKLQNCSILITGGSSGIGLELAKQLTVMGNTIIITGRDQSRLESAKKLMPKLTTIQSDVSRKNEIKNLFERVTKDFSNLNVLVNCAGQMRNIDLNETNVDLTSEIESNLNGPIWMVEQFLPFLKSQSKAAIVNVSSGLAFVPLPTAPVYCATKAALHSFTMSLRVQLQKSKVQVFELAPPATETPLLKDMTPEERKRVQVMPVDEMVRVAIKGIENNKFEIRPGQANQLKFMSRVAPEFIFKMLSKSVELQQRRSH